MFVDVFGTHKRSQFWSLVTIILALAGTQAHGQEADTNICTPAPKPIVLSRAHAVKVLGKDKTFSQGLLFNPNNSTLYEGTGLRGKSTLRTIDTDTGIGTVIRKLSDQVNGGPIALINREIYQVSQPGVILRHSPGGYTTTHTIGRDEKWGKSEITGMTSQGNLLVVSDGSSTIRYINSSTLKETRKALTVRNGEAEITRIAELESARGTILANIADQNGIIAIDPITGCVIGALDISQLRAEDMGGTADAQCEKSSAACALKDFDANGIAFDRVKDEIYITGRNWQFIFVFKFPYFN